MGTEQIRKGSTELLILGLLHEGPRHGYALSKRIEKRSRGTLIMRDGMLYPVLQRLETEGFVKSEWIGPEGGRRRRVYALTNEGLEELMSLLREWIEFFNTLKAVVPTLGEFERIYDEYPK